MDQITVLTKLKWLSLSGLLALSVLLAASNPQEAARLEYQRALDVLAKPTDVTAASDDSALLRGYLLYPYLQAARFATRLERGTTDFAVLDQELSAWFTAQGNAPVTITLRRQWLASLATRAQWRTFLSFYQSDSADAELRCHWLNAQLVEQGTLNSEVIKPVWLAGERLPAACNAPFNWARTQQLITTEWVVARARLALQQGNSTLARELAAGLPADQAAPLLQWAGWLEQPVATFDRWVQQPERNLDVPALQAGWQRLIKTDLDAALIRLPRMIAARQWSDGEASSYVRDLALGLSWSRRPEALRYFARVQAADMTDIAYEWQARAALWAADWQQVQKTIERMPTALQTQARWRYWRARAQQQLNQPGDAQTGFQLLMDQEDNYYAALAAAQLDKPYLPHPKALSVNTTLLVPVAALPGMQRAAELVAVGQRDAADREWRREFAPLSQPEKIAAAKLAHDWGWYDQAIASLAKLNFFDDYPLLYPQPYDAPVKQAAARSGLPTALIYAVMRQETLFRSDARSSANARGLLQLLPTTARHVARQQKQALPSADDLYRPDINVPLGAVYLKSLIDQFNGAAALGIAAYNAGPNAVRRWLPDAAQPADVWIENIPYNETRTYVQRILWHRLVFDWLRHGEPVVTTSWLAQVRP